MVKVDQKLTEAKNNQTSTSQKLKKKRKKQIIVKTGVVYIKHIPHGFYEDEMKGFFSQFGKVLKVCVARSPKTGNSKGFGYVQFMDEDVAKIAAETMDNYLMFEKILKCKVVPPERVTAATFRGMNRRPGRNCPAQERAERAVELLAVRQGASQKKNAQKRREAAQRRTMMRLAQLGIKYDLNGGPVQEMEPATAATGDSSASDTTAETTQLAVLEVDESDDEVTFKTPPNVIKRRLSRPAASTPQSAAPKPSSKTATPKLAATPKTPKSMTKSSRTTATPKTPKSMTKSSKTTATPKTPKSMTMSAKTTTTPKTPKSMTMSTKATATPKTPKSMTKSPRTAATPRTPKLMAKKTPPKSAKQRSESKKTPGKKITPKSERKR